MFLGFQEGDCNRDSSWLATIPRAQCKKQSETHHQFLRTKPVCLSWSFRLRGRLQVWHTSRGLPRCFPGMEAGGCHLCTLLLLCYRLSVSSRKELVYSSGGLSLVAAAQGTPLEHMALVASKAYLCLQSHRTILFAYSKSCCPWVSLSISLNLGAD